MNFFFSSGDAPFFSQEQLQALTIFPDLWRGDEGLGISSLPSLWIDYPFRLITFLLYKLGFSWFLIDKFWWIVVFSIAAYGAYRLTKSYLGSVIYTTNTYILLLFDGGQLGVALAYGFLPWVFSTIDDYLSHQSSLKDTVKLGLFGGILFLLDIRITYIFIVLLIPFLIVHRFNTRLHLRRHVVLVPFIILGINLFWILPSIIYKESILSTQMNNSASLSFFSVADFSHGLSLLHPNYPENLFGRVYFFRPEFLFIPLIAFSLFLNSKISFSYISFGLIVLLGAFLSKGVKEPLGFVYEFLFNTVPGFFLFRDPTKWYAMVALGYSLLISNVLSKKTFQLVFIIFWLFTLRFVFLGKVTGNVSPVYMTQDYERLKDILLNDTTYGSTVWIPSVEKFGYKNDLHPAMTGKVENATASGIKYVIVPADVEKRIFLDDYKYSDASRSAIINQLDRNESLRKLTGFEDLVVYQTANTDSLFMINNHNLVSTQKEDSWEMVIPPQTTESKLQAKISYDPNWRLKLEKTTVDPQRSEDNGMSFILPSGEEQTGRLTYLPTRMAKIGTILSLSTLFIIIFSLIVL